MIRVTAECSTSFARFTIYEVDEKARKLHFIAQGLTMRDLHRLGIKRAAVESLRPTESIDLTIPTAHEVKVSVALWTGKA